MFRPVAQLPMDYKLFKDYRVPFRWSPPGAIIFGAGEVKTAGSEIKKLGGNKVLLVTDKGLVKVGVVQKVMDSLTDAGVEFSVFDECEANPSIETVDRLSEIARGYDMLVGVGGGSPMDCAKAAALLVTNGGKLTDYEGNKTYEKAPLPVVAIPTAAGTGSEVTCFVVITDHKRKKKFSAYSSALIPALSIYDPELTYSLPPVITAATGMDALTHAVEGLVSRSLDPIAEALHSKAIQLIGKSIQRATYRGEYDHKARYDMMMASSLAGMGFTNSLLGISHAMALPLGAYYNVPHGVANAICLPVCMEFNVYSNPEKYAEVARLLGKNTTGLSTIDAAKLAVDAVYELLDTLPIPPLSKYGFCDDDGRN